MRSFAAIPIFAALFCFSLSNDNTALAANDVSFQAALSPNSHAHVFSVDDQNLGMESFVTGTVTLVETGRHLVVLQDGSTATVVRLDGLESLPRVGEQVVLAGIASLFVAACPDYPDQPAGRGICSSFRAPTNWADFYLTRVRGYLHPTVTGNYTFWIASDDSSELWLSENTEATNAQKIASVPAGRFTQLGDWTHYPSQKSREIFLQGGSTYYIEALRQDGGSSDFLEVAWQGPGFERTVIDGRFLSPHVTVGHKTTFAESDASSRGLLWEYWTNFFSSDLSVLRAPDVSVVNLHRAHLVSRKEGELPEAIRIRAGQRLRPNQNFRVAEVEGRLGFAVSAEGQLNLELTEGRARINVRVAGVDQSDLSWPPNSLMRVRGVCEGVRDGNGDLRAEVFWVNGITNVTWLDSEENWSQYKTMPVNELTPSNPDLRSGQLVHVRGRAVRAETNGIWRVQGEDTFQGFISPDGTNWSAIDPPVEFAVSNSLMVGFAVASHRRGEVVRAQFDHIAGLSGPLQGTEIGEPDRAGSFMFTGTNGVITGGGWNIWSRADQCYFVFQKMERAGEIVAHLAGLESVDALGKAALMMRETLDTESSWAAMVLMPLNRMGFQSRRVAGERVGGAISVNQQASWFKVTRRQNILFVRVKDGEDLEANQTLDILGTLSWQSGNILLEEVRLRKLSDVTANVAINSTNVQSASTDLNLIRIKDLAAENRKMEMDGRVGRFRIRGVVTFNDEVANQPLFFVQDVSGGCLVQFWSGMPRDSFKVGQTVELIGTVDAKEWPAQFSASGCAVVGSGSLPEPLKHPFESAIKEQRLGQWVEIEGIGRSIPNERELVMMTRDGPLSVIVGKDLAGQLGPCVNSLVRVRGVYWHTTKPVLLLASKQFLEPREPSPQNPFDLPIQKIAALADLNPDQWSRRQTKIRGILTCGSDGTFIVQDDSGGVRIEADLPVEFGVGDVVEVVGFPSEQSYGSVIFDAVTQKVGRAESPPAAATFSIDNGMDRSKNNLVVALEAVVLQQRIWQGNQLLDLQSGQRAFRALLPVKKGKLPSIENGSTVRVSGVSQIVSADHPPLRFGSEDVPLVASLELLLRSPADVVILRRPPWWNWKYTAGLIGISAIGCLVSVMWIRMLRRRVAQRTGELRETMARLQKETQISATLAERDRLAGEIHDSLEQGLSAIMMQLDAAAKLTKNPDEVARYLSLARNMAGFSRTEVQHAVWDLQSPLLENSDLGTALTRIAREISAENSQRVTVDILGTIRPLPSAMEHHLLRIGQEAVTNAVKHGQPKNIHLTLDYRDDSVQLSISDDGRGFVPKPTFDGNGHFGLQGIRMRARKLNAELSISSEPDHGTLIKIIVPVNQAIAQSS